LPRETTTKPPEDRHGEAKRNARLRAAVIVTIPTGCRLNLESDHAVEQYWFHPNGWVSATLGAKNGAVCAPILQYRQLPDGDVEIFDRSGTLYVWRDIQLEADTLTVGCSGQIKKFKISEQ
jgi:hypothetical protein